MNRVLAHTGVKFPIVQAPMALAGQTVGLIHEILPVAGVIGRTVEGFHAIRKRQGERSTRAAF